MPSTIRAGGSVKISAELQAWRDEGPLKFDWALWEGKLPDLKDATGKEKVLATLSFTGTPPKDPGELTSEGKHKLACKVELGDEEAAKIAIRTSLPKDLKAGEYGIELSVKSEKAEKDTIRKFFSVLAAETAEPPPPEEPPKDIELVNGWVDYGGPYEGSRVEVQGGIGVVSGLIKNGKPGLLAQLGEGKRPFVRCIYNLNRHQHTQRVDALKDGKIQRVRGSNQHSWISLTGMNFMTRGGRPLQLLCGARPYGSGYTHPGWMREGPFVVLSGLARMPRKRGVLARIPPALAPRAGRLIFNQNQDGQTLRVDIHRNGIITVEGVARTGWVSLDGIIYSRPPNRKLRPVCGWRDYGHGYRGAYCRRHGSLVVVDGLLRGAAWGRPMAILPPGHRPRKRLIFNLNNHERTARVDVMPNGQIKWVAGGRGHGWVSLSGMHFMV